MAKQQVAKPHKKLKIFGIALLVLVLGFFIYKYTYIYFERRKYAQAEQAIRKVADDLRTQGIDTEFSKGCGRAQGVFGPGAVSCSVGITYKGNQKDKQASNVVGTLISSMDKWGFSSDENFRTSFQISPVPSGQSIYSFRGNKLQCSVWLTNTWETDTKYQIDMSCGNEPRFSIF